MNEEKRKICHCAKPDKFRWFGNVTGVMLGKAELGKGVLICLKCNGLIPERTPYASKCQWCGAVNDIFQCCHISRRRFLGLPKR